MGDGAFGLSASVLDLQGAFWDSVLDLESCLGSSDSVLDLGTVSWVGDSASDLGTCLG